MLQGHGVPPQCCSNIYSISTFCNVSITPPIICVWVCCWMNCGHGLTILLTLCNVHTLFSLQLIGSISTQQDFLNTLLHKYIYVEYIESHPELTQSWFHHGRKLKLFISLFYYSVTEHLSWVTSINLNYVRHSQNPSSMEPRCLD